MKSLIIYGGILGGIFAALIFAPAHAFAATNINSTSSQHWAWNDEIGWIDFYDTGNVIVSSAGLTGYASSSAGNVSLDCHTSPGGNICGSSNYQATNDGAGKLSGWAWNSEYGWISFFWGDATADSAATSTFTSLCRSYGSECGVSINSSGTFSGYAWNDEIGWISFNCSNTSSCGTSQYSVATAWVSQPAIGTIDSQTFDTGVPGGAQMNSILWQGSVPAGTYVNFQIAVSNSSSGPWNFIGSDGTSGTYYPNGGSATPGTTIPLSNYQLLTGRYFRYRVILQTNVLETVSPSVSNVIVNWSP